MLVDGIGAISVLGTKRSSFHLFEAESEHTVRKASLNELLCHEESCAARATIVVHIVYRDSRKTHLVDSPLPTSAVAIYIS